MPDCAWHDDVAGLALRNMNGQAHVGRSREELLSLLLHRIVEFPAFSGHMKMDSPKALGANSVQANECGEGSQSVPVH